MNEIMDTAAPQTHPVSGLGTTLRVALWALLPGVAISLLGWRYAYLRDAMLPADLQNIDLTNFEAVARMFTSFVQPSIFGDSWVRMQSAMEILHGPMHNRLYETLFLNAPVRFQYPPSSLLPLELLAAMNLTSIQALNILNSLIFAVNAGAIGMLGWLLFRAPRRADAPHGIVMSVLAMLAAFFFYPLVRAQVLGQIQVWIDLLFTLACLSWFLRWRFVAGLLIGLACSIKPQMALLLIWGLFWREWRFAGGILAASIPIQLLSILHYGLHNYIAYIDVLSFLSKHGESFFANNSVNGILNWYFSHDDSLHWHDDKLTAYVPVVRAGTTIAFILALAVICAPPLLQRKMRRPGLFDLGIAAICSVVGSPVAWEHHYGILLPLFLVALHFVLSMSGRRRLVAAVALTVSWTLVANFIPFANLLAHTSFVALQAYCFFGALLLLILLLTITSATHPHNDRHL